MGVRELSGDVKLEVVMVRDYSISQLDHQASLLFERLKNKYIIVFSNFLL